MFYHLFKTSSDKKRTRHSRSLVSEKCLRKQQLDLPLPLIGCCQWFNGSFSWPPKNDKINSMRRFEKKDPMTFLNIMVRVSIFKLADCLMNVCQINYFDLVNDKLKLIEHEILYIKWARTLQEMNIMQWNSP